MYACEINNNDTKYIENIENTFSILKFLCEKGADLSIKDNNGRTVLINLVINC